MKRFIKCIYWSFCKTIRNELFGFWTIFLSWWTKPLLVLLLTFWRDSDFIRFDSKATVGGFFFTWFFSTSTQSIIAFNLKSQHATSLKSRSLQVTKLALFGSLRKYIQLKKFRIKDSQKWELTQRNTWGSNQSPNAVGYKKC